ncbi:uncharacterized protein SPSK_09833 [Sporothrix schenckii 1099-18]|uniref:Uncharacterized protein n=1 Tax=Sporothrix schenckii 1099-18 TaxID=1397361 RepID=A0A0F2M6N8_SPOSC|nr:uncharacterized protein SPSK_09833 [Sporothrix schenckii 1099-18]KJR84450.1 hypothetical protein SPSK_09833 [Sporothrix schenckii 1099-18]
MHDNRSHPLLEQVPLTVSPFVHLPRATTLPYRYKAMPSALPPSIIEAGGPGGSGAPARVPYVTSPAANLSAHPDDILAKCRALHEHVARLQADADAELQQFEQRIQERDLAEKRRVAPGWLDSEDRLLVPEKKESVTGSSGDRGSDSSGDGSAEQPSEMAAAVPEQTTFSATGSGGVTGEALDQAFGSMQLRSG